MFGIRVLKSLEYLALYELKELYGSLSRPYETARTQVGLHP